ncbi:translocation/assembly module TamB domain-containing protein [Variovorax sp. NFACC27]|uniref:translocation/assembly module TamB domain-containing protein n=1 Tax=unclassified Variovorax TaxID=663243 RepID=UPI000894E9DC|nr:autotransporter secretion inner membrane protein TamB [Variovorax sp. NFACC28]SEG92871.1 autotransporter secretion inner membrane protein TamB [Variovorax sp. NFACC29]SFD67433.1 autotransporter secretion inner membrane protein TamB [Variovorax sp. NFACC26]SFH11375.1 autotransporter secretion inner membrane protein TamB [Variovorax sp. NFACC27]
MQTDDDNKSTPPSPPRRSRARRAMRALAWTIAGLLLAVALLVAGAWWWLGSDTSLAFALAQAAQRLPAGQTLESRDVSGSLRTGGRIGWLKYQSESIAVEVNDATIGWQLAPLLQRKVQLGEVHAKQVLIEKRGPPSDKPTEPLEQLALPVEVELPFRVDELRWAGPPVLQALNLSGNYSYKAAEHLLEVKGVDIADGHYSTRVKLQGPAPMAIDVALDGRVKAPLAEDHDIDVLASATVKGTLAGTAARLQVAAELKPAEENADAPMEASLQAQIAPWLPQPVIDAKADLRNVDASSLWPGAPETRLTGIVELQPDADTGPSAWKASADIRNAVPGPWDQEKLPLEQVLAKVGFDGTSWTISEATVRAGGGRIDAAGKWSPAPSPWQAQATVRGVRPGALYSELSGAPVSGQLKAEQKESTIVFDANLRAEGGAGSKALPGFALDRALAQGQWKDQVLDLRTLRIEAQRASVDGRLQVRVAEQAASGKLALALPGGSAQVEGRIAPDSGSGEIRAAIDDADTVQRWVQGLPGLSKVFADASVKGSAKLDASWQGGWRTIQRRLENPNAPAPRGSTEPNIKAALGVPRLDLALPSEQPGGAPTSVQVRNLQADLAGSLAQATLALKGEAATGTQKIDIDTRASGGIAGAGQWRAALASLKLQAQDSARPGAPWVLELGREVTATIRTGNNSAGTAPRLDVEASAASATLRGPVPGTVRIDWQPLRFSQSGAAPNRVFRLQSKGQMQGLPMAWAGAFGANTTLGEYGISGDLMFNGDWDIDAGDTLHAKARLARQSGDIRVQAGEAALVTRITSTGTGTASERTMNSASASGDAPSTPAGLRQAELRLDADGDAVRAVLAWDSERAGKIDADINTRVQQRAGGWQWAPDAPLGGTIKATLPNLGVWSMLAPPGWRIAGTLDASATLSGNRAVPRWNGTLGADKLALRAPVEGLDLRDGRLRATLTGERVEITEFTLKGGAGSSARIGGQSGNRSTTASEARTDGGTLSATGDLSWGPATGSATGIRMALQGQLRALRVLVRTDRQVTLSGDLQAKLDNGQFTVRGKLKTDRAVIILPDETAPSLGSDVVVRSAAKDREAAEAAQRESARADAQAAKPQTAKPPDVAVEFDLGDDFAVQGRGITTRLEGNLEIRSTSLNAPPRITGEVKTVKGQYRAYGQQLDVETGIARFNGPFDNPALDILAIRPNLSQRAGVQITGTAQSPRVKLYSEPALSDAETLSWVILGRASATSGGESALLQQAALSLLGKIGGATTGGSLASRFGLDELGFKGPGNGGDLRESAVTLGKRLSKDFYITYERSIGGTFGTLFIFYDLTTRLTLRGQAGQTSGLDLIYTVKYD